MPAVSKAQQQAAAIALKAKEKGSKKDLKGPAKSMSKMSKAELEKIASTKRKGLPKHIKESIMDEMIGGYDHPGCEDTVGKMFVVLKPSPESSPEDLVHHTHAFGMGQFEPTSVHGVYGDEEEANLVAEAACNELQKHLAMLEKKKDQVISEIEKHIDRLQKEVNSHMKEATEKPEESDMHHQLAERKMGMIKNLRGKHKAVRAAKKELPKKDEE